MPTSMKSTTPVADRIAVDEIPDRAATYEAERDRPQEIALPRRLVQPPENHERTRRQRHEYPARVDARGSARTPRPGL